MWPLTKRPPVRARSAPLVGLLVLVSLILPTVAGAVPLGVVPPTGSAPATLALGTAAPVRFEANRGQSDRRVRYLARGAGYWLFLTPREAVVALQAGAPEPRGATPRRIDTTVLRMEWVGADPAPPIVALEELPGRTNVLMGTAPGQCHAGEIAHARARYRQLYPGIDLDFYTDRGRPEYDFTVAPGADPATIRIRFTGASDLRVDAAGDLVLSTPGGEVVQRAPEVYQQIGARRSSVPGRYVLLGAHEVGFEVGAYDPHHPLVIDPVMEFSTFLGGASLDAAYGVAVDAAGAVYVTGWDGSIDFPTTAGSVKASTTGGYVAKLAAGGGGLVYSAVIPTVGKDIAIDSRGNAWVTSETNGLAGAIHEIDATGSTLLFSRSLDGGSATGIAVDGADNVYVTGKPATDFVPTAGAFQTAPPAGTATAFVSKLDPAGQTVYASYLGTGGEFARDVAVDAAGVAYVTGYTVSTTFPTRNAIQSREAGSYDGFVTAVAPDGTRVVYSTYLGGTNGDFAEGIAVDPTGGVVVTGRTLSSDFPVTGAFQPVMRSGEDAFVAKLAAGGGSLAYSTFLGGGTSTSGDDEAYGVAVDGAGNAVVTGRTDAPNFPVVAALQSPLAGSTDAFVAKLDAAGSGLIWSTYLGGSLSDEGWGVAVDGAGGTYAVGLTRSYDFPTAAPLQRTNRSVGQGDAFVAAISETAASGAVADVSVSLVDSVDPVPGGAPLDYTLTYTNQGPDGTTGVASLIRIDPFATVVGVSASQGSCAAAGGSNQLACDLGLLGAGASATVTVAIDAPAVDSGSFGSDAFVTADAFDPVITSDAAREVTTIGGATSTFALTVGVTGSGTVVSSNVAGISCPPDCTQSFASGQSVSLMANPASGWQFDHWGGDCTGTAGCSVTMTANRSVSATFVAVTTDPPPSPTTDTVTIGRAEYDSRKGTLRLEGTGTDSSATLQVLVTSTGAVIGTANVNGGKWKAQLGWPTNPVNITIESSSGGTASADVTVK